MSNRNDEKVPNISHKRRDVTDKDDDDKEDRLRMENAKRQRMSSLHEHNLRAQKAREYLNMVSKETKTTKNPVQTQWESLPLKTPCKITCTPDCEKCAGFGNRLTRICQPPSPIFIPVQHHISLVRAFSPHLLSLLSPRSPLLKKE